MIEKKRRLTAWLVIAVGALVIVLAAFAAKDKVVEQWYLWKLDSGDADDQRTAIQMLGKIRSASAAPRLVALFREQNKTRWRTIGPDDLRLREALAAIGEPTAPDLIELTRDRRPSVRRAARSVLGDLGSSTVSHLVRNLRGADEEERLRVLRDLSVFGTKVDEVPTELIEACGDSSSTVRVAAISAIAVVAPELPSAVDVLLRALRGRAGITSQRGARLYVRFGRDD